MGVTSFKLNATLMLVPLLCLSSLGDCLPAKPAKNWSSPAVVSENLRFWSSADAAIDSHGNVTTVYACYEPKEETIDVWIEASTKMANGSWSEPVALTQKADASYGTAVYPSVAVDQEGNVAAIWNFPDGKYEVIQAATLPFGSPLWIPAPGPLATHVDRNGGPVLFMDKSGNALVAWGNARNETYTIESTRFSKRTKSWTALAPLQVSQAFTGMKLHVNAAGTAWLIWAEGGFLNGHNVTVSTLVPKSQTWSHPESIVAAGGKSYSGPQIISDLKGNVLATWQEYDGEELIFASYQRLKNSKTWQKTSFQNVETHIYTRGWLSLDSAGNALFVWEPDDYQLLSARLAQGQSTWTLPALITGDDFYYWQGATDAKGNRLISWLVWNTGVLKTATLSSGETTWSDPVEILTTEDGSIEDCKLSAHGSAVILFSDPWTTLRAIVGKPFASTTSPGAEVPRTRD